MNFARRKARPAHDRHTQPALPAIRRAPLPRPAMPLPPPIWEDTIPSEMDQAGVEPVPFREALEGLAVREVSAPDVFQRYFGTKR